MDKHRILGVISLMAMAFVFGYCLGLTALKSDSKTVQVEKQKEKDTQTHKTITKIKKPNGEVQTVTTIDSVSSTKSTEQTATKSVAAKQSKVNVSALLGYDFRTAQQTYGVSITKSLAGPITGNVWGVTNTSGTTIGIGLGLDF